LPQKEFFIKEKKNAIAFILKMERKALDLWGKGNPSGFLKITDPDVVYFDPFLKSRLDGLEALINYYERIKGKVHIDRYELINPKVILSGNTAVLTFNYVSYSGKKENRWNCTEVYRYRSGRWSIIHTHWSITQLFQKPIS
jgi:hypothetical protein